MNMKEREKVIPKKVLKTIVDIGFILKFPDSPYSRGEFYIFIDNREWNFDFSNCQNMKEVMSIIIKTFTAIGRNQKTEMFNNLLKQEQEFHYMKPLEERDQK